MVIMRIAHLNRAPYEADQHAPIALREGMRPEQLEALAAETLPEAVFDARERAVLAYTDAMTRAVQVPDAVFEAVRPHFDATELVELTATIAAYNMVSRFLEALRIHSDDAR
jgi:alkylhydroperoxidase family enzyme